MGIVFQFNDECVLDNYKFARSHSNKWQESNITAYEGTVSTLYYQLIKYDLNSYIRNTNIRGPSDARMVFKRLT
jgi:hypothetical protein